MQYYRIFYEEVTHDTADYERSLSHTAVIDEPTLFVMLLHKPSLRYIKVNNYDQRPLTDQTQWSTDTGM
jgi:hypothetical protein